MIPKAATRKPGSLHAPDIRQAIHFLAALEKQRAPHDVISYNSTMSACERSGEWHLASNLSPGMNFSIVSTLLLSWSINQYCYHSVGTDGYQFEIPQHQPVPALINHENH